MMRRILFLICILCSIFFSICAQDIKSPNVAGVFYPNDPEELTRMIDGYMSAVNPQKSEGEIFALISPHAGYAFSGEAASFGYKLIRGKPYKTVIVMGPSHYYGFKGVSVYPQGAFRTPLGDLEIDSAFTQRLLNRDDEIFFAQRAFEKEHSVEVQLPFLQRALRDFKIVPIVIGDCSFDTCQKLSGLLKEIIGSRRDVLIVASTDMYHGYDYREAEIIDDLTLSLLKQMQPKILYEKLMEGKAQLCGGVPVVITLSLSKELGHDKLQVLKYTNSALVTGQKNKGSWTVGYASCVIDTAASSSVDAESSRAGDPTKGERAMLNKHQRERLLKIARNSIETYLKTSKKLELTEADPLLLKEMGAFVTLHKQGQLRGCIGNIVGQEPLYLTVRDMAVEAAVGDPRFPEVNLSELKDLEIEISALSPLERIDSPDKIELGKHGVLVRKGYRSGVFLPQVATETGWSKEEFLAHLCSGKAGLSPDAWKDKATEVYIFSAEVFSEKSY